VFALGLRLDIDGRNISLDGNGDIFRNRSGSTDIFL
jgi:hypothetical protein